MMRVAAAVIASVLLVSAAASPTANRVPLTATPPAPDPAAKLFPEAPEKALVIGYCGECHTLAWVRRSGGSKEGWSERMERMIRAGAKIPRSDIPAVAVYLARALPIRARPQPPSPY